MKTFFSILNTFRFVPVLLLFTVTVSGQNVPDTVNRNSVTELQTIQTPSGTIVASLMLSASPSSPAMEIYRSTDNGASWDSVFYYGSDSLFDGTPDPVITCDEAGNIFIAVMRYLPPGGWFKAHMWIFRSTDDGLTWSLSGKSYDGPDFSDYPSITSLGNSSIFHSYTLYRFDTSYITFKRSIDGGASWLDSSTFATLPPPSSTYDAIGSDLGWSVNNRLCISYGDYNYGVIYFSYSLDSGATWATVQNIPIASTATYIITKVVSNKNYPHLGIIAHKPHYTTDVYYLWSLDTGLTWQYQTISSNSAYCEGEIDASGNVHLVYNEDLSGSSRLCYRYSTDMGQTFTSPVSLLSWSVPNLTAGEYQSMILGQDGLFHVTYIDWNQGGTAKHIVFAPMLTSISQIDPQSHAPEIFPNPAQSFATIKSDATNAGAVFDIINVKGEVLQSGKVSIPETSIDLNTMSAGIYLVRITVGNLAYIQKLVKN